MMLWHLATAMWHMLKGTLKGNPNTCIYWVLVCWMSFLYVFDALLVILRSSQINPYSSVIMWDLALHAGFSFYIMVNAFGRIRLPCMGTERLRCPKEIQKGDIYKWTHWEKKKAIEFLTLSMSDKFIRFWLEWYLKVTHFFFLCG